MTFFTRHQYTMRSLAYTAIGLLVAFLVLAFFVSGPTAIGRALVTTDAMLASILRPAGITAQILLFITYLANPEIIILLQVALLILIVILKKKMLASFLVGGLIVGELVSIAFKILIARARPPLIDFDLIRYGYSFPSNHALIALVFYGFIGYCLVHIFPNGWQRKCILLLTYITIFLIGFSRVALGFHWATDVIGGWLLGGAILCVLILVFRHLYNHVQWGRYSFPHGLKLGLIIGLAIFVGFCVFTFYVTHPLKNRSTIESSFKA